VIRNGLYGFAVSLLCLLIPILHFVTGPLAPFIGGVIAGSRHESTPSQAIGIGLLMGLLMAFPVAGVLAISNFGPSYLGGFLPRTVENSDLLLVIGLAILGYTTVMATFGAVIGGYFGRRSHQKPMG